MKYLIKTLEPGTGNYILADTDTYEAASEKDALLLFAQTRKNDFDVEELSIINDDPAEFTLKIKAITNNIDCTDIEIVEGIFEYIAEVI